MALHVPVLPGDADPLTAALAYAAAGWHVVPVRRGTKNPGSVLGADWDEQSTRDPETIAALWAGTSHGVALHAGRSGAVVFDVDHAERLHPTLISAILEANPPHQSTREGDPSQGHYVFSLPAEVMVGNGLGQLASGWGEVRGRNGVIVVAPSLHPDGGRYSWARTGAVPLIPAGLLAALPTPLDSAQAVTDEAVEAFLDAHTAGSDDAGKDLIAGHIVPFEAAVRAGESRHQAMTGHLAGAMREAAAGLCDARSAADNLEDAFLRAVTHVGHGKQGHTRTPAMAAVEWAGLLRWAVAQAKAADPDATRARVTARGCRSDRHPRPARPEKAPVEPVTLDQAHYVFRRWLGQEYDTDALDVVLAAAAAERLDGDPLWVLLISGSGNAKTETVQALDGIGAIVSSTITSEGALLSASSKKDTADDATGGLLRRLGDRGVLVVKDVTSILSMNRDLRSSVLAAVREVYDGRWSRNVGTDGGRTLEWSGRIALIGAVTTAWDRAHDVIASMGDRFVLIRMDSTTGRQAAGRQAIGNTGSELEMRADLAEVVAGVIAGMDYTPTTITREETDLLLAAADLVTRARTGVDFDYRGDVIDAHAPEMPTRFAKQLAQVVRGAVAIGVDRHRALQLAIRCARDSMLPLRLAIVDDVAAHPGSTTADVRRRLAKPRATVDRQLQALHMLEVLDCDEEESSWRGSPATIWRYRLAEGIEPSALDARSVPDLSVSTRKAIRREAREAKEPPAPLYAPPDISGTDRRVAP